jgi:hypothetical protein
VIAQASGFPVDEGFRPYRHLAVCVISRAVMDAVSLSELTEHRASAREFLADSAMLRYWCRVAALDAERITRYVEGLGPGSLAPPLHRQGVRTARRVGL